MTLLSSPELLLRVLSPSVLSIYKLKFLYLSSFRIDDGLLSSFLALLSVTGVVILWLVFFKLVQKDLGEHKSFSDYSRLMSLLSIEDVSSELLIMPCFLLLGLWWRIMPARRY